VPPLLTIREAEIEVLVAPERGNRITEMTVRGQNILCGEGIPFLAPFANRMSEGGFWANGRKHEFNADVPTHNGLAIHGVLQNSPLWEVTHADITSITSRLEFWKHPELMANWPIPHEYKMTCRLANGALEVAIAVRNLSEEPMPVVIGFHPYFHLPGVQREEIAIHIPARTHVVVDERLLPTGERKPFGLPAPTPLAGRALDDVFTDLARDTEGRAWFRMEGGGRKLEVAFGPKWIVGTVWSPANEDFVCFEPMAGVTNAPNLHHEGKYPELQMVAPGDTWRESFWIRA
jgi:aldose 1-epimerase